jgi:lysophospholipase L1-like esterase
MAAGANDSVHPHRAQHVEISKFAENLYTTISLITSPTSPYYSPETIVYILIPPPVNPAQLSDVLKSERSNVNTKKYAEMVKRVGDETGVSVIDVWTSFWEKGGEKEEGLAPFLSDGLHLTGEGYKVR